MLKGKEARDKILSGMSKTAEYVTSTLGRNGKSIIIRDPYLGGFTVTKDGVSVAKSITLEDPYEEVGAGYIKASALKTVQSAGDGTTSTTLLTNTFCQQVGQYLESKHVDIVKAKKDLEEDLAAFEAYCDTKSKAVKGSYKDVKNVATISSNDPEIGELVAKAYEASNYTIVNVKKVDSFDTTITTLDGYKIPSTGYQSTQFITDYDNQSAVVDNPKVYVFDGIIRGISEEFKEILWSQRDNTDPNHRPVVIIYQDIDGVLLNSIMTGLSRQEILDVYLVKCNLIHNNRKNWLTDLSKVVGGEYGDNRFAEAGTCEKVVISREETIFFGGKGDYKNYLDKLKENPLDSIDYKLRVEAMDLKTSMVNVGGVLSSEIDEKYDRVEDAVLAVKSALKEGIVPGAGSTYIHFLKEYKPKSRFLEKALFAIQDELILNSDADHISFRDEVSNKPFGWGVDLSNLEVCLLEERGIVDPALVIKESMRNAIKTATSFLTIEGII